MALLQIERVLLERRKRHDGQRFLVRGGEHHRRRDAGLVGLAPRAGAYAPAIAWLEAGKVVHGNGRDEIVALPPRELQEIRRHLRADDVQPEVLRTGVATAVTIEPRQRTRRARRERAT